MQNVKEHFNKIPFNKGYFIKESLNKSLFNFVINNLVSSFMISEIIVNKAPCRAVIRVLRGGRGRNLQFSL